MKKSKNITRRAFLKKTAGIAGGMALYFPYFVRSSALGRDGGVAASERITIGFIGVGNQGVKVNLKNFLGNTDAQVLAVCDVDTKRRNAARDMVNEEYGNKDCSDYNDFREILARDDIDAVMISTPDHWHVPIAIAAARAGKDIECEKPTLTVQEGRILCEVVKRYSCVFQWSTEDRSIEVYHRMCELVRNGRIGKLHTVRVGLPNGPHKSGNPTPMPVPDGFDYDMWLGPAPWAPYTVDRCHYNFRWILDYSGGQFTDWGTHLLDVAQWGSNTEHTGPVEVLGKGRFWKDGLYNTAREYKLEYTYADGLKLFVNSGTLSIRFEGSEGWIGNHGWRGKLRSEPASIADSVIRPDEVHLYTCRAGEQRNFLDCVRSRKQCYFPPEKGQRCFAIAHIGNISILLGRKLKWNPDKEQFVNDEQANKMLSRSMRSPWHL